MDKNLKDQTIKYAKHFSAVLSIPCTVVDLKEHSLECSFGTELIDVCRNCPHRDCAGYRDFAKGCEEAYRWDGLYIFYCASDMVLICASVTSEDGSLQGGLVLGPIILDNKDELMADALDPEFARTLEFIRQCAFSAMHIFPYSKRSGTPAASAPGQVQKAVKTERAHRAAQVAEQMSRTYLERQVGKEFPVLFEELRQGAWRGHTPNYLEVSLKAEEELHNQVVTVRVTGVEGETLLTEKAAQPFQTAPLSDFS